MMRNWLFCFGIAAFMMAAMFVGGAEAFAQGGNAVEFAPLVDLSGVFGSLTTVVASIVGAAIALAGGVWVTKYIFSLVKSMGR